MDIEAFLKEKYISFYSLCITIQQTVVMKCLHKLKCEASCSPEDKKKNFYIHSRFERKQVHWINENTFDILLPITTTQKSHLQSYCTINEDFICNNIFLTKLKHMRPIFWNANTDIFVLFMVVFYFKVNKLYPLWKKK